MLSRVRWIVRGDVDGFFGLALDNLVQLLLIDTLCRGVLGFPPDMYTCLFAVARMNGWTAHVIEQLSNNRIIRPESEWIGPNDVPYVPIEERG